MRAAEASIRFRGGVLPAGRRIVQVVGRRGWPHVAALFRAHLAPVSAPGDASGPSRYAAHRRVTERADREACRTMQADISTWAVVPRFVVVLRASNPDARRWRQRALASLDAQHYPHWSHVDLDEPAPGRRVQAGASAAAARHVDDDPRAERDCLVLCLDVADTLHPMALYRFAAAFVANPGWQVCYADTDCIASDGTRANPWYKGDFNYELLLTHDYLAGSAVFRSDLLRRLGGFEGAIPHAQVHDLVLRGVEACGPASIGHVPLVLVHRGVAGQVEWGRPAEAPQAAFDASRAAVQAHLRRIGVDAELGRDAAAPWLLDVSMRGAPDEAVVEILIPTRDRADLLEACVASIVEHTPARAFRVCIIDNDSREPAALALIEGLERRPGFRVLRIAEPFNFSTINNRAVAGSRCDWVCLMNNDVVVRDPRWLTEMLAHAARPGVGCVGARLWYPDDTLQHAGIVVGLLSGAGHAHRGLARGEPGYFGRAVALQAVSAVTAACMLVRRSIYTAVGGFDPSLAVAFNDVDFCLKVAAAGHRNVWVPAAELVHHESRSRGYEDDPAKLARLRRELDLLESRWGDALACDRYYSRWLTRTQTDYALAVT
ncbi:MAG: glycosyltransferase [Lautropia sp.]